MVKGAALNAECKLFQEITLGDHIMFIGEVIDATQNSEKKPLVYHDGKYWSLESIIKPKPEEREKLRKVMEKHRKKITCNFSLSMPNSKYTQHNVNKFS